MAPKSGKAKADDKASLWQIPGPLEGVKSQKRAIFKLDDIKVASGGQELNVTGVALTLDSRVAAVADIGSAIVSLLLREQEPVAGEVTQHKALNVVRLGPHLAVAAAAAQGATDTASCQPTAEAHLEALAAAFRSKPQVVVLEEACKAGGATWAKVFHDLLRSEGLRDFRGAVVVCAAEETFALRRVCAERWAEVQGSSSCQEAMPGRQFDVIEDVLSLHRAAQAEEMAGGKKKKAGRKGAEEEEWVVPFEEARALNDFIFEEDLVKKSIKEKLTVSLLTETKSDGTKTLLGYICYKKNERNEVYIARLAVPMNKRKFGAGGKLCRWLLAECARMPTSECASITCSALDNVVAFYNKLGFAVATPPAEESGECEEDPQTWMAKTNESLVC